MTSGVSGSPSSNQDPSLTAQIAQNARSTGASASGKAQGQKAAGTDEALGFEDLIQDMQTEGSSKKEKTSQTTKSGKTSKSEKSKGASSTSTVAEASKTATAGAVTATKLGANYEAPHLPFPESSEVNGVVLRKGKGTLALLGQIMALLAEASGKSWSASFQQQNQAIANQIQMAPEIGEAIRSQANSQAAATEAQAKQSLISGIVNVVGFALTVGMGTLSALKSGTSSLKAASFTKETGGAAAATTQSALSTATQSTQQTATAAASAASSATSALGGGIGASAAKTAANLTDDMATAATKATTGGIFGKVLNTPNWSEKVTRGFNVVKQQGARAAEFGSKVLGATMQMSQVIHGLSAGIEGITGGVIGAEVAEHQRAAGEAEARAEMLKQLSSVQGQYAGQAGQLQEQAYSAFKEALQTLNNIADSQTQTTSAIFN
ncbi:type III secretion system translocon subunit SctE [Chlamydia sp. 17-3921]|uniref:type III secretion system translocon subunit SctE n=1 Tax=Chlamydia sp. 17-3921 TaxID=2675798 RepID=UPI00191A56DB|nr:type III secretion system translocon subunit SctE [Chlamydia sp. 17-3921]